MITASITIDLSSDMDPVEERRRLEVLDRCRTGTRVVVDLGNRRFLGRDVAYSIHRHDCRLMIEIVGCDPAVVGPLVRAARSGDWGLV